jgi:nicotinate-nucleotide adenylyltransferase
MICTAEAVEELLDRSLSSERAEHSRRVADLAADLCRSYGIDPQKGILAGLAHDLAREMPEGKLRELAARDGGGISALEDRYPALLHGRAAAVHLREEFAVDDPDLLEAAACHVTGCPGMGLLAKILFVADFLEPGRGFLKESDRKRILKFDVDRMVVVVLEQVFQYLRSKHRPIAEPALKLYYEESSRI